jgi:hypothetical protein
MRLEQREPNVALRERARLLVALTARSLRCRDTVRLQCYVHRPDEPVSMPARDPNQTCALSDSV